MESPVVLDKPPEYHGIDDRGFPFDDEEGSGGWSELAARHPDIAARLRQRPATWARKRRPSSQDATDDFGDNFSGFDRFPFDDIPPEFREHLPSHWNRRFGSRDEPPPQTQASPPTPPTPQPQQPQQQTAATQTEQVPEQAEQQYNNLPQYGLRNTVDLGQKSAADPSLNADARNQRSMSAPPDSRNLNQNTMNSHNHQDQAHAAPQPSAQQEHHSNVRHIPIFVEGRDEPVINKSVDSSTHFGDTKPTFQPPPPPPQAHPHPHIDRDQYFTDDVPSFHHPPNFSRAFGTPFNKGFRQGPQPFTQQKAYPQGPFARGASPQRSHSPKPQAHEEHFVKVPVHHEQAPPRADTPSKPQQKQAPPQQKQAPPQQKQAPPPQNPPQQREQTPPQAQPKPQPAPPADPITQILSIQTDVLNLMTEVENFTGTKKDKRYLFLDEMLTRNLIKLDNIETEGKENIRQARKEAIRCIQKCIAVLEAKAENNTVLAQQNQDVEMKEKSQEATETETVKENGEVKMQEANEESAESQAMQTPSTQEENKEEAQKSAEITSQEQQADAVPSNNESTQPQVAETKPGDQPSEPNTETKPEEPNEVKPDNKTSPKKKVVKKNRDKSANKDNKSNEAAKDSNKKEENNEKVEGKQVDSKAEPQSMEVDAGASQ